MKVRECMENNVYYLKPNNTIQDCARLMSDNHIGCVPVCDDNKKIVGGHEITIVGAKNHDGELYFVCNDTDDDSPELIEYHEDYIVPKIHHVGLPTEIVEADSKLKALA